MVGRWVLIHCVDVALDEAVPDIGVLGFRGLMDERYMEGRLDAARVDELVVEAGLFGGCGGAREEGVEENLEGFINYKGGIIRFY